MEVLLEDIKRTLGAKRIYLPGSAEEARYLARKHKHMIKDSETACVEEIEVAVGNLGIGSSSNSSSSSTRRSRVGLSRLTVNGESDKENLSVLRSRMIKVNERMDGQLEMVGVP